MAAYLVAACKITNPTEDFKKYISASEELLLKCGGEYVVRGGADIVYEGGFFEGRVIIISRWPTLESLKSFCESDEYQKEIKPLRDKTGIYDIACYEGT